MNFRTGRNNLALTIFVPYDCKNNCRFCTSKEAYREKPADIGAVVYRLREIMYFYTFPISDVVFTGGEPMENVQKLKWFIDLIEPCNKKVYINTTFTRKNMKEFVDLVNENNTIRGVNISRHGQTFGEDAYLFEDIAEDEAIAYIKKPVRINCLDNGQNLERVIDRWKGTGVELSIRRDYRKQITTEQLHNPYDPTALMLVKLGFSYIGKTQCNVCDTTIFKKEEMVVRYHKGLERSSIMNGNMLEFNDLIINQAGDIAYDWKGSDERIMREMLVKYNGFTRTFMQRATSCNCAASYCGGSNSCCGGSGC